jgi:hypothetical protein
MRKSINSTTDVQQPPQEAVVVDPLRNRMEIIRFKTREDLRKAMGIFRDVTSSEISFTFRKDFPDNTCVTNTATVRVLLQHGLAFEWLTENV